MSYSTVEFTASEITNVLNSAFLPPVHGVDNYTALYYRKYLFQKLLSVFDWELPTTWNRDYFLYTLFGYGFITIFDSGVDGFGVIPQRCGISGYNIFYQPRKVIVSNPLIKSTHELIIDDDCTVLKVNANYTGVLDIIDYYAVKLAMISADIESNLFNSKLSYVFSVSNQTAAASMKKLYDQIGQGNPAVILDKQLLKEDGTPTWEVFQQNLKNNYLVSDLLQDLRRLENDFCTKVGIPTVNNEKRERMTTTEVTRNDVETESLAESWLTRLNDDVEKTNRMFPNVQLKVKKRWNNASDTINTRLV